MPAPEEAFKYDEALKFNVSEHYTDAVWENARMNNIAQHFVTAWMAKHIKGDAKAGAFLELTPNANDSVWAKNDDGTDKPEHNHRAGFPNRTAKGLRFETLKKGE